MDFFHELPLSQSSAEAMARGLYAVAKCDGLHEREAGLIASFWIDAGGRGSISELERSATIKPTELAAALHNSDERMLFIKTAVLLTWADGKVTDAEKKTVTEFARALGIDASMQEKLETAVKEFLLGQLAHLSNTDATTQVAKKLKV
jgi:tellurite resistance protein